MADEIVQKDIPTEIKQIEPKSLSDNESKLFGVSIRGWIAVLVVGTICFMSMKEITVMEPLYTLGGLVVGFYYGTNSAQKKKD